VGSSDGLLGRITCTDTGSEIDAFATASLVLVTFTLPVMVPVTEVFRLTLAVETAGFRAAVPLAVPISPPVHATA
jgi:hypothetical protein